MEIHYIQPRKPTQNSLIERLNKSCRNELLNMYVFKNLQEPEEKANQWWIEYNYNRPHEALGNISPKKYKQKMHSLFLCPFIYSHGSLSLPKE
ncbi:transposase [Elizabethkingia argentiflava]|uniref:Transposase n=1 Tax=Elizabethkingia argenteiflava TaxID=2681556 RepID=A0A845PSL5_9FLAO|nr:transposase [Elizabethkingia argenteiflava]